MINQFAVHEQITILFLKANSHFAALNLLLSEKKLKKLNISLSNQYL